MLCDVSVFYCVERTADAVSILANTAVVSESLLPDKQVLSVEHDCTCRLSTVAALI